MAKVKKKQPKPKPNVDTPGGASGWDDPWKYINAAPNSAFSPQLQANPPAQPPPVDPAYAAWQTQRPALEGNIYSQWGNPALLNDPNASFEQKYGYEGTQLLKNLGLTEAGQIDPNNPYGQASLLQRSYQQGQRGTTNSMAAQGHGYSGAHQRQLDEGTFQYNRQDQGIRDSFSSGLHGISQYALGALNDLNTQGVDRLNDHSAFNAAQTPVPAPLGQFMYQQAGSPQPAQPSAPSSGGQPRQMMARWTPPKKRPARSRLIRRR